jgi:hypothetical protein
LANEYRVEELMQFFKRAKGVSATVLASLDKTSKNIQAHFQTQAGQELLKDDIGDFTRLLEKIINEEASTQELAEFRVVRRRLEKISQRLDSFLENVKKIGG